MHKGLLIAGISTALLFGMPCCVCGASYEPELSDAASWHRQHEQDTPGTSEADWFSFAVQRAPSLQENPAPAALEAYVTEKYRTAQKLSPAKAKGRGIKGGEEISFSNGADKTEDYDETTVDVAPKLVIDGDAGAVSYISQWGKAGKATVRTGKVSGETAQTVTTPAQDCVVTVKNITPDDGKKLVALTFDDGPSDYT